MSTQKVPVEKQELCSDPISADPVSPFPSTGPNRPGAEDIGVVREIKLCCDSFISTQIRAYDDRAKGFHRRATNSLHVAICCLKCARAYDDKGI